MTTTHVDGNRWLPGLYGGLRQRVFKEAPRWHPGVVIHGTHHKTFRFHAAHELHRRRARGKAQQVSNALVAGNAAVLREVLAQGVQVIGASVGVVHGNIQVELFAISVNNSATSKMDIPQKWKGAPLFGVDSAQRGCQSVMRA